MAYKRLWFLVSLLVLTAMLITACQPTATEAPVVEPTAAEVEEFTFGLLMVGPYNDHGWSQAHYDAGLYVEQHVPGEKMIYIDKVNSADSPGTTPATNRAPIDTLTSDP